MTEEISWVVLTVLMLMAVAASVFAKSPDEVCYWVTCNIKAEMAASCENYSRGLRSEMVKAAGRVKPGEIFTTECAEGKPQLIWDRQKGFFFKGQ